MSNLIILTVDDWVVDRLERRAQAHGRPPGQEAKAILHDALGPPPEPRRRKAKASDEGATDVQQHPK